jgi:demethylmenaquinone methyltransferase / 2-methoxy-6-polyprenyl-1,4-benzoquinol methylase
MGASAPHVREDTVNRDEEDLITQRPTGDEVARVAPHRALTEYYGDPGARGRFVRELFDSGAPEYDWVSSALSLGTDRRYRRQALARAGVRAGLKVLDVATGTGLVAQAALDCGVAPGELVGLDPSRGMLGENRRRRALSLIQGRGESLPFADGCFDVVTMGYALRHVDDLGQLFGEFHRVLRVGGRVIVLEITRPTSRWGCGLMSFYMRRVLPACARLAGRGQEAVRMMDYYWATIAECVPPERILEALRGIGFSEVQRRTTGPLLSDYLAVR